MESHLIRLRSRSVLLTVEFKMNLMCWVSCEFPASAQNSFTKNKNYFYTSVSFSMCLAFSSELRSWGKLSAYAINKSNATPSPR